MTMNLQMSKNNWTCKTSFGIDLEIYNKNSSYSSSLLNLKIRKNGKKGFNSKMNYQI